MGCGDECRGRGTCRQVQRARFHISAPKALPRSMRPPLPPPFLLRGLAVGRAAVAYNDFSAVSSPSCEGKLPLSSLP